MKSAPPLASLFKTSKLHFLSRQRSITAFISECKWSRTCASLAFIDYNIVSFLNGMPPLSFFLKKQNRRKLKKRNKVGRCKFLYSFNIFSTFEALLNIHVESSSNTAANKYIGVYAIRVCMCEGMCSHFSTNIF